MDDTAIENLSVFELIERNTLLHQKIQEEIKLQKRISNLINCKAEKTITGAVCDNSEDDNEDLEVISSQKEDGFEKEVQKYFVLVDKIKDSDDMVNEILAVLPSSNGYGIDKLIKRLCLEFYRKIVETRNFIDEEKAMGATDSDLEPYMLEMELDLRKKEALKDFSFCKDGNNDNFEEAVSNKLIFLKSKTGRVKVFDDLECIDRSCYAGIFKLCNSIVDGTFRDVKRFSAANRVLGGLHEVRDIPSKTRVFFAPLVPGCYVLIGAMVKKVDRDAYYLESVKNYNTSFQRYRNKLINSLQNPDFLVEQEELTGKLYEKLGVELSSKVMVKIDE